MYYREFYCYNGIFSFSFQRVTDSQCCQCTLSRKSSLLELSPCPLHLEPATFGLVTDPYESLAQSLCWRRSTAPCGDGLGNGLGTCDKLIVIICYLCMILECTLKESDLWYHFTNSLKLVSWWRPEMAANGRIPSCHCCQSLQESKDLHTTWCLALVAYSDGISCLDRSTDAEYMQNMYRFIWFVELVLPIAGSESVSAAFPHVLVELLNGWQVLGLWQWTS